jgi:hypothetical protein
MRRASENTGVDALADALFALEIEGPDGSPLDVGGFPRLLMDSSVGHPPLGLNYDPRDGKVKARPFDREYPGMVSLPFDFDHKPDPNNVTADLTAKLIEFSWLVRGRVFQTLNARLDRPREASVGMWR